MWHEALHEAEFDLLPLIRAGTRRQIKRHHTEIAKIGTQITAFGINVGNTQTNDHLIRLTAAINAHAAIPFFVGIVEIALQAGRIAHLCRQISLLCLQFLQTNHIRLLLFQPGKESLVGCRTNAVEIGTDNPHFYPKSAWLLVLRPIRGFPLMCYA